jgi:hypothetical protein
MGIRFYCPNGHKLNVKSFLAGQKGICPYCGIKVDIPLESTRAPGKQRAEDAAPGLSPDVGTSTAASTAMEEPLELALLDLQGPGGAQPAIPYPEAKAAQLSTPVPALPASRTSPPLPMAAPVTAAPVVPSAVVAVPQTYVMPATTAPGPPVPPAPPLPPSAGPTDPLTEAPDSVWYVRPPSGGQFGPAASSVMRGWLQEGRISADSLVWREGWRDWQEAIGVFPQLRGDDLALLNAVIASPIPAMPTAGMTIAAAHHRPAPRQRSKTTQIVVVALLAVVVLVLLVVFLWVLRSEPTEPPADKTPKPPVAAKATTMLSPEILQWRRVLRLPAEKSGQLAARPDEAQPA